MKNSKTIVFGLIILLGLGLALNFALAQTPTNTSISGGVQKFGNAVFGGSPVPLPQLIANIINGVLALLGIVFLILIIYGGFTWMTAMGAEEKVKKAKAVIIQASIGLIIVLLSYGIATFVFYTLAMYGLMGYGGGGTGTFYSP